MSRFLRARLQPIAAYVPGEQPKVTNNLIKLNTNESPYPPSPKVIEAMESSSIESLRLYSDLAAKALIGALAEDLSVSSDMIAVGNGSDEVIYFAMMAFGESGARFADITYGFYKVWAGLLDMPTDIAPLKDDFSIDVSDYAKNDRMILIANPNAPTGIALPLSDIEAVLKANPGQVVLIDEAYVDFGAQSALSLIDQYENLLIARTFSKSRQMAGARLGFLIGQSALIADVEKIRYSINPYNVNSLTQRLGAASVRDCEYFTWACNEIINTREWTAQQLEKLGFAVLPSKANFLFAKGESIPGGEYMNALREQEIIVRHFEQPRISDYVRITIGTMAQMERLIKVTKAIIGGEV